MEAKLVLKAGYPFAPIEVAGIQRKPTVENFIRNAKALILLAKSGRRAVEILNGFSPDVVVGTGGYVSGPVVRKAARMGFKTVTHEQNAYPGITTKLLAPDVDKVLLAVKGAQRHLKGIDASKIQITGNPVREAVLTSDRTLSRHRLGINGRLCILSFGGSLGARRINEAIADLMMHTVKTNKIHHIHATGSRDYKDFLQRLKDSGVSVDHPQLDIREYIDNMPVCLAAADLVICRAGAVTISELQCAGRASILIPSPNVAENHQFHNAMELVRAHAAQVIVERELTGDLLCETIDQLAADPQTLADLGSNASAMAITDAAQRIAQVVVKLAGG
jgi:UDP-N-acetylglucosamine--N-acetylmuramyl-(pentapeptide) pyrophosphoryl-undecaprenol N-acetylglucosamine transferase